MSATAGNASNIITAKILKYVLLVGVGLESYGETCHRGDRVDMFTYLTGCVDADTGDIDTQLLCQSYPLGATVNIWMWVVDDQDNTWIL